MLRQTEEYTMLSTLLSEPHRKYHNINHINDCLTELENFCHPDFIDEKRSIVEAAIWYHDAIYNPYSKLNEYNSMLLANQYQPAIVREIIMYTARHLEDVTQDIEKFIKPIYQQCVRVMLDIDLSGFGKDRFVFASNGMNIRHEYYNTNLTDFLKGRMAFYQALVKRPTLYYTKHFYDKYHAKSRENMTWEMHFLNVALESSEPQIWCNAMKEAIDGYNR